MYTIEFECVLSGRYWRQWADERFGDLPPKVDTGAFSGQRQGWKTPQEDPWQCTASVCVASALLGDLLEVNRSRERDLPFCPVDLS